MISDVVPVISPELAAFKIYYYMPHLLKFRKQESQISHSVVSSLLVFEKTRVTKF